MNEIIFNVNNVWDWVQLGRWIITAILGVISIILAIKKRKVKFSELINNLFSWIEEAETHTSYTGDEKREFVLNRAFKYCTSNHIGYDEEKVADEMERILAVTKSVNVLAPTPKKINSAITGKQEADNE